MQSNEKIKITAAEVMVKCLEREGIRTVFGYPGAAICPFYDKLIESEIEHILVRQESNGGHAASGYARITGKPAVCIATSGPGATNLITSIATAYMDSIPMVAITGQVNTDQIGRDVFQEADITGAAEPFVKHSYLIKDANILPEIMKKAFYIAGSGRPGPVLLDVPFDVQTQEIEFSYNYPETVDIRSYKPQSEGNKLQIKRVYEAVMSAKKPLICAGGGLFSANAAGLMHEFAERADIPVVCTMMGISSIPASHRLYFGMLGMHGRKTSNRAVSECDLLILLGARVGDRAVSAIEKLDGIKVVHIDVDPAEIGKNLPVTIPVVGDLNAVLKQILKMSVDREHTEWVEYLTKIKSEETESAAERMTNVKSGCVNPIAFIEILNKNLPEKCVVVADVGQNQIWTANNIALKNGRFITSGGMGTMGYSVPAAIGAKKAAPQAEVVAICGDGSFQMQLMELATMVQHEINVKIIIMVNNRLGMVRELQTNRYGDRQTAVFLDGSPDFIKLAAAYGIEGEYIRGIGEAENAIKSMLDSKKPYVLQVHVDKDEKSVI